MTSLSDLTREQIRMMIRLDDGFQPWDGVGRAFDEFEGHEFSTADSLVRMGLVELAPGRGLQLCYRLTTEGTHVRDEWGERPRLVGVVEGRVRNA